MFFSNRFIYRIQRHAAFWGVRISFLAFSNLVFNYDFSQSFSSNYWAGFKLFLFLTLIADVGFCYFLIYFLVSKYFLQKRYLAFAISFLLSVSITSVIGIWYAYSALGAANLDKNAQFTFLWGMVISALFVGPTANWPFFSLSKCSSRGIRNSRKKLH